MNHLDISKYLEQLGKAIVDLANPDNLAYQFKEKQEIINLLHEMVMEAIKEVQRVKNNNS